MAKEYSTPGPRAIYPEICDSRSLAKCGVLANALWPRLIAQSDDQGRLAGDAIDVLGLCFPKMLDRVTVRQIGAALGELEASRMIVRYSIDDEPYLQLATWWEWQRGMRRAYPSRHPAPEGWADAVYGYDEHPKTYREARGLEPRRRAADDPEALDELPEGDREPHAADSGTAREPHAAVSESPDAAREPHRAALARAQPRVRGAVPGPTVPDRAESPPPPAERGTRKNGTAPRQTGSSPRDKGENPRANGTAPRQEREAEKRGGVERLADILERTRATQAEAIDADTSDATPWVKA